MIMCLVIISLCRYLCLVLYCNVLYVETNVKYSVFFRRSCLVGGLCYENLELVDLWFPIDGNCVINCFLWVGGYPYFKRGSVEFLTEIFLNA